jgi:DNA polymerase-3 subunit epsilon
LSLFDGMFGSIFGARVPARQLDGAVGAALARWHALPASNLRGPLQAQRWLVVDVETTGLDLRWDRLLAIGAVLVDGGRIRFDQSFEVVIRQETASRTDNILIHRIAGNEQLRGMDAASALAAYLAYAQKLPCVAFHAVFDETMLKRAVGEHLGIDYAPRFIDLALLAPALIHDAPPAVRSLDEWVEHFSIAISARHRAVADAVGTAQLFQVLLSRAAGQGYQSAEALFKLARDQRWLSRAGPN